MEEEILKNLEKMFYTAIQSSIEYLTLPKEKKWLHKRNERLQTFFSMLQLQCNCGEFDFGG
jgi:hypothetical protein